MEYIIRVYVKGNMFYNIKCINKTWYLMGIFTTIFIALIWVTVISKNVSKTKRNILKSPIFSTSIMNTSCWMLRRRWKKRFTKSGTLTNATKSTKKCDNHSKLLSQVSMHKPLIACLTFVLILYKCVSNKMI